MWWDIGYGDCSSYWRTDSSFKKREYPEDVRNRLKQANFETMIRVLQLESLRCQKAAIHGLGHSSHPDKEKALRQYLADNPNLPEWLRLYTLTAIE
jgi:hypothetical protein